MKQFQMHRVQKPKKSVLDLSHEVKATMKMGYLYPVVIQETLPGDIFSMNTETLIRLMPMVAPMMHRVNVYVHYFRVPNRLIMKEWETFLTGGKDGKTVVNLPKFVGTPADWALNAPVGSLHDFMGIPCANLVDATATDFEIKVSQLPYRALLRIYDDYYRDQTLVPEVSHLTDSADINVGDLAASDTVILRKRAWEKDYFTSALPWTQRGDEVSMPLGISAEVKGYFNANPQPSTTEVVSQHPDGRLIVNGQYLMSDSASGGLWTDLTNATSATINELRRSFALQRWLEKNARGGSRLIEHVLQHFGVKSSDARLQRAEYLGGGKFPVQISEVLSTQRTDEGFDPLGTMGGHGVSGGMSNGFRKSFCEEHGYIIGVMSILPRTGYYQGIPRHMLKTSKYDFYYKDFAHIGEQPVYQNEVFLDSNVGTNNEKVFGYQERYAEYRTNHDRSHGEMNTTMLHWHMNRQLNAAVALNANFVESQPTERIFAVEDSSDKLIVQMYHKITAIRPVAKFGDPI